jgi:hypothetical protein
LAINREISSFLRQGPGPATDTILDLRSVSLDLEFLGAREGPDAFPGTATPRQGNVRIPWA